jgi:putative heme-binding domain-containing protein
MVDGEGGRFGPDLSDVGALRSSEFLRKSVVEPNADVDMAFWSAEVVLGDGSMLSGIRLHEDSFSIRVIDITGQLHSLWKQEVQDVKVLKNSVMGSYGDAVFPDDELDDLVAYMVSLRKEVERQ